MPVWPNLLAPSAVPPGTFPLFTGIRVFDRDYRNPRIYSVNVGFERELAPSVAVYVDFTVAKGVHLTRFLNYNVHGTAAAAAQPPTRDTTTYTGAQSVRAAARRRVRHQQPRPTRLYRGATIGVRKRFSQQLPARSQLRARQGRRRRLERARSVHRSDRSTSTI